MHVHAYSRGVGIKCKYPAGKGFPETLETPLKPPMVLDTHTSVLNSFLLQPWLDSSTWKPMKGAVCDLADAMSKCAAYLQQKNIEIQYRKITEVWQWVQPSHVACYRVLQNHLDAADIFQPILLNEFAPADTRYEKNMHVYVHFYLHTQTPSF